MGIPFWKYIICGSILISSCYVSIAQEIPQHENSKTPLFNSEEIDKIDTLLKLSFNEYRLYKYESSLELAEKALKISQNIEYNKGLANSYLRCGETFSAMEKFDDAEFNYLKSESLFSTLGDTSGMIICLRRLSRNSFLHRNVSRSIEFADKTTFIARKINNQYLMLENLEDCAELYSSINFHGKAQILYEELVSIYEKLNLNAAKLFISLGRFYVNGGKYSIGINYFRMADSAIAIRENMEGLEHRDRCFLRAKQTGNIARAYRLWGYYDSSLFYHRLALKQMFMCEDWNPPDIGNQLEGIGIVYTQFGVLDSARICFQKSISYREGDPLGIGFCYDGLGYISQNLGDYEGAANYYIKALSEKSKFRVPQFTFNRLFSYKEGLSISHQRLGLVYTDWNLPELAFEEFNKALDLCREIGFASGETEALIGIGKLHLQQDKLFEAQDFFLKALQKSAQASDLPMQAITLKNLGILKISTGAFEESLNYLKQAAEISQKVGNPIEMAEIDFYSGKAQFLKGDYTEAEKKLQESLELGVKHRISKIVMDAHDQLAKLYEKYGNTKLAFLHLETGSVLRDSVFSRQTALFLNDISESNKEKKLQLDLEVATKAKELKNAEWMGHRNGLFGLTGLGILLIVLAYFFSGYSRLKSQNQRFLLLQKVFRSCLNPAFINASLEDLTFVINHEEPARAVDYISEFARYIQQVLQGMRNESLFLREEVQRIRSYMHLKKSANPGCFDFVIDTDSEFEFGSRKIQPIAIQPAIDQAIQNIFCSENAGSMLKITIHEKETSAVFIIEDNGPGMNNIHDGSEIKDDSGWNRTFLEVPYEIVIAKPVFLKKIFSVKWVFMSMLAILISGFCFNTKANDQKPLDSAASRYRLRSDQFRKQNNYDSALHYFRLYLVVKDSLDKRNRELDLEYLEKKYNIDIRQSQIDLVNNEKSLREIKIRRLRYSLFGVTGLLLSGFLLWLLFRNRTRLRINQEIKRAEQYLLLSQMNPHFIYNALTNIQSLIMKRDKEASFKYMGHFRELTVKILENSDLESVSLENELQMITSYINLQKLRYGNKFDFLLSVSDEPGIMDFNLPPMILQPFVENAIEHGLKHKEDKGLIAIRVIKNVSGSVKVEIEDNGIGRKKSMEIAATQPGKHHGLATIITQDRIKRINQEKKMEVSMEIKDLTNDSGNAAGTLVQLNFNQYKKS
jgi:LytS/YehU family sensor histidine kinase/Tfp pilus assembly protein PilF